jgi:hypothetical protein
LGGLKVKSFNIPELVPYLGKEEKNFIGNGIAGAGGDTNEISGCIR